MPHLKVLMELMLRLKAYKKLMLHLKASKVLNCAVQDTAGYLLKV